jgi:hypothetical protein
VTVVVSPTSNVTGWGDELVGDVAVVVALVAAVDVAVEVAVTVVVVLVLVDEVVVSAIKTAVVSTPFTSTATFLACNEASTLSAILTLRSTTATVILLQLDETETMSSRVTPSVFEIILSTVACSTACKSAVSQSA